MIHLLFGIVAAACSFVQFAWEKCNRGTAYRCAAVHPEYEYLSMATRVSDAAPVEQAEFRNRDIELVGE
jgi:hypothetical protein